MGVILSNTSEDGKLLQAIYWPEKGLNLISFKAGDVELIDQSTKKAFDERFGGLGPMIGPHFHHRNAATLPPIKDESLFPHIAFSKAHGSADPFSHGIGRYAPWKVEATENTLKGTLTGKDVWQGIPLAQLEGENFQMVYQAALTPQGLKIEISVVSDKDSVVGLHYYYHLPDGKGRVLARVQETYVDAGVVKPIPAEWIQNNQMVFDLSNGADYTFHPAPDPLEGHIMLETSAYRLKIKYQSLNQENSWQLYHPVGASFVAIEPLSAQDPRHPNLTVSSISVLINPSGMDNMD